MLNSFFYSKSTKLYVSRKPLEIDSRIKRAAIRIKLKVDWDDVGRINYIDFNDSKHLLDSLGGQMMSPIEYWKILRDANEENDTQMVEELMSNKYCEWLDRVYLRDGVFIDHADIKSENVYTGQRIKSIFPYGRPGWFNPENNIDFETGLPKEVELFREKHATSWKYWSPDFSVTKLNALVPIRGYVTSVGKPSFDLGIPVDSCQPVQLIRECRVTPLKLPISGDIMEEATSALELYDTVSNDLRNEAVYTVYLNNQKKIENVFENHGNKFEKQKGIESYKIHEMFNNALGLIKICEINDVNKKSENTRQKSFKKLKIENFKDYIEKNVYEVTEALTNHKDIVFVMGHKNPDADTVISSLFEAWRNSLTDREAVFAPVVQGKRIPDEVTALLGKELSDQIMLTESSLYEKVKQSGLSRWISVDQNRDEEVQKYFISIIDHHAVSEEASNRNLPKTLEFTGSCTALIAQKMLGMDMSFDKDVAKILLGAALLDTENRVIHKMTVKDTMVMDFLKEISQIDEEDKFYGKLMSHLLNTDDPNKLFHRDYKEDWGFGFAVAKIKGGFSRDGDTLKIKLVNNAYELAKKNTKNKNLPLTILRITDYEDDNINVNRERVYLAFSNFSSQEFKDSTFEVIEKIIRFEFLDVSINKTEEYIEFWGSGLQLSRKKTAPILEPVVKAFNEFFFSKTTDKWVYRDFLKLSSNIKKSSSKLNIAISKDELNRVNHITYPEAVNLANEVGFSILSLQEYWQVLDDAKEINDSQMISSMQGSNFVEFFDSVILNKSALVDHPKISLTNNDDNNSLAHTFTGDARKVTIPEGSPGLIHTNDIDKDTGIPVTVRKPNEYGNSDLWRYWEPDANQVIVTRSYIFLLQQPCWEGKFHINDSFPNLGIRPCYKTIPLPIVNCTYDDKQIAISINFDGDTKTYEFDK